MVEDNKDMINGRYAPYGVISKEHVKVEIKEWLESDDIEEIFEPDNVPKGTAIGYFGQLDLIEGDRIIYFAEDDTCERIRKSIIADKEAKEIIDMDLLAEFVYKYIDVNATSVLEKLVVFYDHEGDYEKESEARHALFAEFNDEYAFEICDGDSEQLGINWYERQVVGINLSNIIKAAIDIIDDYTPCEEEEQSEFMKELKIGIITTLCHEFRHLVVECNEVTDSSMGYPEASCVLDEESKASNEDDAEQYGISEYERLALIPEARELINSMIHDVSIDKLRSEFDRDYYSVDNEVEVP